jgi:integrase
MKTPDFPKVIKGGNAQVKIYETPTKGYPSYTLVYYEGRQRKRESNADYDEILTRAREIVGDVETGRIQSIALSGRERESYERAMQVLSVTGQPLDVAASHYAQAYETLGGDLVIEAAKDYKRRHSGIQSKLVSEVVEEFLATREKQNRSARHLESLSSHCTRFAGSFKENISTVNASVVDLWLDKLDVSPRTRDNVLGSLSNLFEFAKSKHYLPKDHDELSRVTRLHNGEDTPVEIYTPDEMTALLKAVDAALVPFVAIGGFAGLRSSEIERLDWKDVKFDSNCIVVQKGKVKKRGKSRRVAPLLPNLKIILEKHRKASGPVWPHSHAYLHEAMRNAATRAEITLKDNALRHSFVSYRVAAIKNVPQVAYESGNSPQIIHSNYLELVIDADVQRWFAITMPQRRRATGYGKRALALQEVTPPISNHNHKT